MIETENSLNKTLSNERWSSQLTKQSRAQQRKWKNFLISHKNMPSLYRYNLTICDNPKFVWFRNAKVATRTILKMLEISDIKLKASQARHCYYSPQTYKDYFKFAFVRNPWDRLVSGWHQKVVENNIFDFDPETLEQMRNFDRFIDHLSTLDLDTCNIHFRQQNRLIDFNEVHYIGRLERFNDDILEIFNRLKLPEIDIIHSNKNSKRRDYQSYYTPGLKQKVEQMYRKDIQLFGYSF